MKIVIFEDPNVLVTPFRLVVNNKTYPIRNISSVSAVQLPKKQTLELILILIGILVGIGAKDIDYKILGGIIVLLGMFILVNKKNVYAVLISTNSGEVKSLSSTNRDYIYAVVDSVNEAVVQRG